MAVRGEQGAGSEERGARSEERGARSEERGEARGERREARGERREARGERRKAKGERRKAKGERRKAADGGHSVILKNVGINMERGGGRGRSLLLREMEHRRWGSSSKGRPPADG